MGGQQSGLSWCSTLRPRECSRIFCNCEGLQGTAGQGHRCGVRKRFWPSRPSRRGDLSPGPGCGCGKCHECCAKQGRKWQLAACWCEEPQLSVSVETHAQVPVEK